MNAELEAAIPAIPMTQLIIVPAPVMDMGADATMLRIVPAPVTDMGADATMIRLVPAPVTMGADATMLRLVPAPVTDMGADATMLQLVPTIRTDMGADATMIRQGMDTTMDPISEDERTAKVHVYQTPLASNVGKDIRDIDDSRYNQRSNVNMTSLLYT